MTTIDLRPPEEAMRRLDLAREDPTLLLSTHALEEARAWLRSSATYLVFCRHPEQKAGTGRGKTLAMTLAWRGLRQQAARAGQQRPREVLYLRARDLKRLGESERDKLLLRLSLVFGLVVDELGTEPGGPGFLGFPREDICRELADVLETRGDRGLRTVFGGNGTTDQTFKRYGQRLLSRVSLNGGGRWIIKVEGEDLRVHPQWRPLPECSTPRGSTRQEPDLSGQELKARSDAALKKLRGLVGQKRITPSPPSDIDDVSAEQRRILAAKLLVAVEAAAEKRTPWAMKLLRDANETR